MLQIFVMLSLALATTAIPVLKFRPLAGSNHNPNFTLTLDKNQNLTGSFSICARFKFNIFSSQCIFVAEDTFELYFNEYRHKGGGNLNFANIVFTFPNDFDLEKLLNWQNICITFDQPTKEVKLFLNSERKLHFNITSKDQSILLGSKIWLGNCLDLPFDGEMADVNVWSRYNLFNYWKIFITDFG